MLQAIFIILFFFFLAMPELFAQTTSATIEITGATGASFVAEDFKTIYGGTTISGDTACSGATAICNSCTGQGPGMQPCNETEIDDNVPVSINFTWNGDNLTNKKIRVAVPYNSGLPKIGESTYSTIYNLVKGQGYTVTTTWGRLCAIQGCTNCRTCTSDELSNTIAVGVDDDDNGEIDSSAASASFTLKFHRTSSSTNADCFGQDTGPSGQGVCSFDLFPGDGKLYLDKLAYLSGFPTSGAIGYQGIDVFYTVGSTAADLNNMTNASAGEFYPISDEGDKDFQVTGLENDTSYCVILGARSKAGNITNFYPHSAANGWNAPAGRFCETPQEVYGVLDGKKCFIATAAFGSELDAHVERFRQFRNQFLKKTHWGKELTMFYYKHSPRFAEWLNSNPTFKPLVLSILWVVLGFIELCFALGMGTAFALVIGFVLIMVFTLPRMVKWSRNHRQMKGQGNA